MKVRHCVIYIIILYIYMYHESGSKSAMTIYGVMNKNKAVTMAVHVLGTGIILTVLQ